jgi:hypothetical protein
MHLGTKEQQHENCNYCTQIRVQPKPINCVSS